MRRVILLHIWIMWLIGHNIFILIILLLIVLNVSFVTLYEQYLISIPQSRLGPNKNSLLGIIQAFFDGVKLIKKSLIITFYIHFGIVINTIIFFIMSLLFWLLLYYPFIFFTLDCKLLLLVGLIGIIVYYNLNLGMLSNSKFSLLGSIRFIIQSLSFEVRLFFISFIIIIMLHSVDVLSISNVLVLILLIPITFIVLVDLNRTPFDLSEGESELVSGFNTEFRSLLFTLAFLGEYCIIVGISMLLSTLLCNRFIIIIGISYIIIYCRRCYPRYRYDGLIRIFWFRVLITTLILIIWLWWM